MIPNQLKLLLGGVGGADASKENLIYYLDKHKEVEQLSLW